MARWLFARGSCCFSPFVYLSCSKAVLLKPWMNVLLSAQRLEPRRYGQRLVWPYHELTDFEFFRNYRMTKGDQFWHLVTRIRYRLPGATALGKARQVASSGAAVPPEFQLSIVLRCLAGGSYIDICRVHAPRFLSIYGPFCQVTKRVIEAILAEMNHLVSLDLQDEDLLHRLNEGFRRKPNGIARGCMQWCN
jgi:hypothetical protein